MELHGEFDRSFQQFGRKMSDDQLLFRAVGAGQAGQAMAWPLFDRFLGKDRHNFLVRMRSSFSHQLFYK